jgi:2-amino-4-hydroxy-6-hydroxymethyldihydropteridine diphosphokinase
VDAYVALGSNLGDRAAHIAHALRRLGELADTRLVAASAVVETAPVGPPGQGPYLNAVAQVRTRVAPAALLGFLLLVERERGRERVAGERNAARTLDLDLLLYGDWEIRESGLEVPHPRMGAREFVLGPLGEIAPRVAASFRARGAAAGSPHGT